MSFIDFGSSEPYMKDGKHVKNFKQRKFNRNLTFVSKNYFKGNTLSRRDDIISIVYNLFFLMDPH